MCLGRTKGRRDAAALSRTEPRVRLADAVRRWEVEEVEQVVQRRRIHRCIVDGLHIAGVVIAAALVLGFVMSEYR